MSKKKIIILAIVILLLLVLISLLVDNYCGRHLIKIGTCESFICQSSSVNCPASLEGIKTSEPCLAQCKGSWTRYLNVVYDISFIVNSIVSIFKYNLI